MLGTPKPSSAFLGRGLCNAVWMGSTKVQRRGRMGFTPVAFSKSSTISPGSAWRPRAFLLKISSSSTITSNRPWLEGIKVRDSMAGVNFSSSSPVKLRARGV